jgi:DNA replication protein DnaC
MSELLEGSLRSLGLKGMLEGYQEVGESARRESMSYEKYLEELLERERQERTERRVERLRRQSRLPPEKTLESFDRGRLPAKLNAQLNRLLEGEFVRKSENVLAFGNPGSGKSHLICALGDELIGRGHAVLFRPCSLLVQDLLRAKRDLELAKALKKLRHFEVLVIDDIGYVQQSREEMEVLFGLLADRYERGSVMVTSNLAFSEWEKIFRDPMTTAAAIDRLVHHSVILELNLPSYRLEQAKKRKKGS